MMNTRLEYEVFSTYFENASYNYRQTSFSSDVEYLAFQQRILFKSAYDYNIKLTASDKIITLSTCNKDEGNDMRSITHARLVRQIVYDKSTEVQTKAAATENTQKKVISANMDLSELSLNYSNRDKQVTAVFTPSFISSIASPYKDFATELPSEVEAVSLLFKTSDPKASVNVTFNDKKADPLALMLRYGENVIKIKVISRDTQYTRTYTITATRLPDSVHETTTASD